MNLKKNSLNKHLDFILLDYFLLIISFFISYTIRIGTLKSFLNSESYRTLFMFMILVNACVVFFKEPYKNILKRSITKEIKSLIVYVLFNYGLTAVVLFMSRTGINYSRLMVTYTYIIFGFLSFIGRMIRKITILKRSKQALISSNKKIVVISDKKNIDKTIEKINNYNFEMYEILGLCLLDDNKTEEIGGYKVIANKNDILSFVCHNWIDEVFIDVELNKVKDDILKGLAVAGISTNIVINKLEEFEGQSQTIKKMFNSQVLSTSVKERTAIQVIVKRLTDVLGGIVGSVITLLLAIFIGPIIKIKSPGPIFYKQERIGLNGRHFFMFKFRSMITNADDLKSSLLEQNRIKDGMMFKVKDDPRIIPGIGEFIRKTSLDEFPQFFNVIKGDMSLVGTRPPTVDEWVKYKLEHRIRMSIKPGITGLWQINGRSKITDFNKVIEYDTKYINNWSLGLDLEILCKTIRVLFIKREDEAM